MTSFGEFSELPTRKEGKKRDTIEAMNARLTVLSVRLHMLMLANCCHREHDWNQWLRYRICCCSCNAGCVGLGIWILFCLRLLSSQNAANCSNFSDVKEKGVKGFLSQKIKIQQNVEGVVVLQGFSMLSFCERK